MTTTWQLKCWNSMHIHNNSVLHYLSNMAVGLVIYSKARAFKAKAKSSRPRPRPRNLAFRPRPRPRINITDYYYEILTTILTRKTVNLQFHTGQKTRTVLSLGHTATLVHNTQVLVV